MASGYALRHLAHQGNANLQNFQDLTLEANWRLMMCMNSSVLSCTFRCWHLGSLPVPLHRPRLNYGTLYIVLGDEVRVSVTD